MTLIRPLRSHILVVMCLTSFLSLRAQQTGWGDDFESYTPGPLQLPTSNGWESGQGNASYDIDNMVLPRAATRCGSTALWEDARVRSSLTAWTLWRRALRATARFSSSSAMETRVLPGATLIACPWNSRLAQAGALPPPVPS